MSRGLTAGRFAALRLSPSTAGRLRITATAHVRRGGRTRSVRVASVTRRVSHRRTSVRVRLTRAARARLRADGHLTVRFTLRLVPAAGGRPVTRSITVTLRSGARR